MSASTATGACATKVELSRQKVVEPGRAFVLGDFTVTPFSVPHDSTDNVGYQVECEGCVFVLMTDIGHFTDEMRQYIARATHLVIEADYEEEMLRTGPYPEHLKRRINGPLGHTSNAACAEAIAASATQSLRHVWLCHLSDENNHPELAEKTVKQILRSHGIIAGDTDGADFRLNVLKRKTPSGPWTLE